MPFNYDYQKPKVIAEIGCNHMGNVDIAKKFIDTAKYFCEVKHIKFQKRNNKEFISNIFYLLIF